MSKARYVWAIAITVISLASMRSVADDTSGKVVSKGHLKALTSFLWAPGADQKRITDHASRAKFASAIRDVCADYRNAVPTLTPDEQTWLDTELRQTGARLTAAANSPIYARSEAAGLLDRCVSFANAIATDERTDNGPNWADLALTVRSDDVYDLFSRFGASAVDNSDLGIANLLLDRVGILIVKNVIRPELY